MGKIPAEIKTIVTDYVNTISKKIPLEKVVLFGSYAKGKEHLNSDIDIAFFSEHFKDMSRIDGIQYLLLDALDYPIDIEPQAFAPEDWDLNDQLIHEIKTYGIELEI